MLKSIIGENAGKVWVALRTKSPLSFNVLKKNTQMDDQELNRAIGWLARESKIRFEKKGKAMGISLAE